MKVVVILISCFVYVQCVKVEINEGTLEGQYLATRGGRKISAFMGIPYAEPPLNELRFKPPVPKTPWHDVRNATTVHAVCPQRDIYRRSDIFEGEEDCLYLNVYTPKLTFDEVEKQESSKKKTYPVMVFLHGGGWLCGGGNIHWYGPDVLLDRDVILVVPNYRLGALGFLSTDDEVVPGNNGLKDQTLALKWVQRNIKYFGGDPAKVTIFGESAGGSSTHYHMLSPASRGLFARAIAMSGTALCPWALAPEGEPLDQAEKLAKSLNCPTDNTKSMISCLRKQDAMEIVKKDVVFMDWDFDPMIPFKPVVEKVITDHTFISEHPIDIIKNGKSAEVPLLIGITSHDGALRAAGLFGNPHLIDEMNKDFDNIIPMSLIYEKNAPNVKDITRKIKDFYFKGKEIDVNKRDPVVNMYTDGWFLACTDEAVRMHRRYSKQPIYMYKFAFRGQSSFTEIFGDPVNDYGVCHADDLQYLFPVGDSLFPDKKPNDDEKTIAKLFTTLFTNFAIFGNPTPEINEVIPERWTPVISDNLEYYRIDKRNCGMKKNLYIDRVKFWRTLRTNPKKIIDQKEEL